MFLPVRVLAIVSLVMAMTVAGGQPAAATGAANDHTVLILSTSVSGGASSQEAQAAMLAGMDVEIATPAQWAAKTAADFATYRALILGDPTCVGYDYAPFPGATAAMGAAIANASVWGPAVTGKAILIGTDVTFHYKTLVAEKGIAFAVSEPGKTGAYITLSCYYHYAPPGTPLTVMDGFSPGGFTVTGVGDCFNDAHIVATHPALTGLTDAYLSDWWCSVHEAIDRWPVDWQVLAIAETGSAYTAPDGTTGIPYILARGVEVISDIDLTPTTGTQNVGTSYTLTATVTQDGVAAAGKIVTFTAIAGPNTGLVIPGAGATDAAGQTTATYTSAATGTDTWKATFVDSRGRTQTSNTATVTWTGKRATALSCSATSVLFGSASTITATLTDSLSSAGIAGKTVTFTIGASTQSATTGASGSAIVTAPLLGPGAYTVTVAFAGDTSYFASSSTCAFTVPGTAGKVTAGTMRDSNNGRGGFNVQSDGSTVKGELQYQNDSTKFHASTITTLAVSPDKTKAWFAGTAKDGRSFTAYVEDNGEPGTADIFQLWIDGVSQNGTGALTGGNVQIH